MADGGSHEPTRDLTDGDEPRNDGRDHRGWWLPGRSPNPGGRRKGSRELAMAVWDQNSPRVLDVLNTLWARAIDGDTSAAALWLERVLGKPKTAGEVTQSVDAVVAATSASTPEAVRALALRALAQDIAGIEIASRMRPLTGEEHARLVAVARATAPTRAEDADPLAGKTDDEVLAEARRLLQAPGAEQREPVEVSEVGECPADREGGAGLDREGAGGAQAGDP